MTSRTRLRPPETVSVAERPWVTTTSVEPRRSTWSNAPTVRVCTVRGPSVSMWKPQALTASATAAAQVRMRVVRIMGGTLCPRERANHAALPPARWGYPPSRAGDGRMPTRATNLRRDGSGDLQTAVRALLSLLLRSRPGPGRAGSAPRDAGGRDGTGGGGRRRQRHQLPALSADGDRGDRRRARAVPAQPGG